MQERFKFQCTFSLNQTQCYIAQGPKNEQVKNSMLDSGLNIGTYVGNNIFISEEGIL